MAGADMRLGIQTHGTVGRAPLTGGIDASSRRQGDYVNEVNIDGKRVYVTASGLEAYKKVADDGALRVVVCTDPSWISRMVGGDPFAEDKATIGRK